MAKRQNQLIELDCLIDPIVATIMRYWPGKFETFDLELYRSRRDNRIWLQLGIEEAEWVAKYNSRDVETLRLAAPTELALRLRDITSMAVIRGITTPVYQRFELYVNIYPYVMSDEEQDVLKETVEALALDETIVTIVNHPVAQLTPSMVSSTYDAVIMRDLVQWLEAHPKLGETPIPRVVINYPAVMNVWDEEVMDEARRNNLNPFTTTKAAMADFVSLDALDVGLFSLYIPSPESPLYNEPDPAL